MTKEFHSGDLARLTNLRNGEIIDVVVIQVQKDGKVIVEDAHGPKPRRSWIISAGFLSRREVPA